MNNALIIALFVFILSGVVSFYNQVGMGENTTTMQYTVNESTWTTITEGQQAQSGTQPDSQTQAYTAASFNVLEFVLGSLYVKGILDAWAGGFWVFCAFTAVGQAALYVAGIMGALSWALGKSGGG